MTWTAEQERAHRQATAERKRSIELVQKWQVGAVTPAETLKREQAKAKRSKPTKYKNRPCTVGAEKYRSQKERDRHQELKLLQRAGPVYDLRREVVYELAPAVVIQGRRRPPLRYVADFVYMLRSSDQEEDARMVVEDCKGVRTEGYRIKRHLLKAVHGIEILET